MLWGTGTVFNFNRFQPGVKFKSTIKVESHCAIELRWTKEQVAKIMIQPATCSFI
ncbi:hypothetical protein DOT_2607 [Desulfosporosinus sp. OT]|nr:hypothetical protein DOT_2607 [Desulfosporosinus sp. OT]